MPSTTPAQLTAKTAYRRLQAAGYPRSFVEKLLPDWWSNELLKTSAGAFQFAAVVQQRLGLHISFDGAGDLAISTVVPHARFKHRRDTKEEELSVSANLGKALARLALHTCVDYRPLPKDPQTLRQQILGGSSASDVIDFRRLGDYCWSRGIPVLFLSQLPQSAKRMAGMVVRIGERPAIILGFQHDQQARQLFILAHELGHLVSGHVEHDGVLIDESLSDVSDAIEKKREQTDEDETEADRVALMLLRGTTSDIVTELGRHENATSLVLKAHELGQRYRVDAGHLLLSYGLQRNDWITANLALSYVPQAKGALNELKQQFFQNAELSKLSEENRDYLCAAQGYPVSP